MASERFLFPGDLTSVYAHVYTPDVIILVWDLIVGSLVEISDARRLFPHLTTVYGLPSMFSSYG